MGVQVSKNQSTLPPSQSVVMDSKKVQQLGKKKNFQRLAQSDYLGDWVDEIETNLEDFVRTSLITPIAYTLKQYTPSRDFVALSVLGEGNFGTVRLLGMKKPVMDKKDNVNLTWLFNPPDLSSTASRIKAFSGASSDASTVISASAANKSAAKRIKDGETVYAGKTMPKPGSPGWREGDFETDEVINEIRMMRGNRHPNIVTLFHVYESAENYTFILEYAGGGHLKAKTGVPTREMEETKRPVSLPSESSDSGTHISLVSRFKMRCGCLKTVECAIIMADLMAGVAYLHAKGIGHRDLKPENLLFRTEEKFSDMMIADFGFAKKLPEDGFFTNFCGSPTYMAPEVVSNKVIRTSAEKKVKRRYNLSCDIWSCGIILYEMLSGLSPFQGDNSKETMKNIKYASLEFPSPYWDNVDKDAIDLCKRMLVKDFNKRATAIQALTHPFVQQNATDRVALRLRELLACGKVQDIKHLRNNDLLLYCEELEKRVFANAMRVELITKARRSMKTVVKLEPLPESPTSGTSQKKKTKMERQSRSHTDAVPREEEEERHGSRGSRGSHSRGARSANEMVGMFRNPSFTNSSKESKNGGVAAKPQPSSHQLRSHQQVPQVHPRNGSTPVLPPLDPQRGSRVNVVEAGRK